MTLREKLRAETEAQNIICKLLNKLEDVSNLAKSTNSPFSDFCIDHEEFGKNIQIKVLTGTNKDHLLVETYKTKFNYNDVDIAPGSFYRINSSYIYYLIDNIVYVLPTNDFKKWVNKNTLAFQQFSMFYKNEENPSASFSSFGMFVPISRMKSDFMNGKLNAAIYRIKDNPNSETEIEYIKEF